MLTTNEPSSPHVAMAEGRGIVTLTVGPASPATFALSQNLPNPFSSTTLIRYTLPREADVTLDVFDLNGQRVPRVGGGRRPAAPQAASSGRGVGGPAGFPPGRARAGVYFYRLRAGALSATRKMLLVQ